MAGLPGTGLGGIFYALLVMWMAARETWRLARGGSSLARWGRIARFGGVLAGIIAALWAEGWLLQYLLGPLPNIALGMAVSALVPALAVSPFVILAALILWTHAARLILRRRAASSETQKALPRPELIQGGSLDISPAVAVNVNK